MHITKAWFSLSQVVQVHYTGLFNQVQVLYAREETVGIVAQHKRLILISFVRITKTSLSLITMSHLDHFFLLTEQRVLKFNIFYSFQSVLDTYILIKQNTSVKHLKKQNKFGQLKNKFEILNRTFETQQHITMSSLHSTKLFFFYTIDKVKTNIKI